MPGSARRVKPQTEASGGVGQEKTAAGQALALDSDGAVAPSFEGTVNSSATLLVGRAECGLRVRQRGPVASECTGIAKLQQPAIPKMPIMR